MSPNIPTGVYRDGRSGIEIFDLAWGQLSVLMNWQLAEISQVRAW
jgi:hypothetical protein